MSTNTLVRIPKPADVPSGCRKVTSHDFSGGRACCGCGRMVARCGHGLNHGIVDECCVGMLVVEASWPARPFESQWFLADEFALVASTDWAVCPTCIEEQ